MTESALLSELEPVAARLLERHMATTKEWFPHEVATPRPDDAAPDFDGTPGARSAFLINLLTEDNLPAYFLGLTSFTSADGAWGEWSRRWTAEEGRHAIALRSWVTATGAIDPFMLERSRMHLVSTRWDGAPTSLLDGLAYTSAQELATRVAHRNAGAAAGGTGERVFNQVAADENLHFLFYRDAASEALDRWPDEMMAAISRRVIGFQMPGTGIIDFDHHARAVASAGIFDVGVMYDNVLVPLLLRHWKLADRFLPPDADKARCSVLDHLARMKRVRDRIVSRREERTKETALATSR